MRLEIESSIFGAAFVAARISGAAPGKSNLLMTSISKTAVPIRGISLPPSPRTGANVEPFGPCLVQSDDEHHAHGGHVFGL
jgi:hypothetical protein